MKNTLHSLKNSIQSKVHESKENVKKISQAVVAAAVLCLGTGCAPDKKPQQIDVSAEIQKERDFNVDYTHNYSLEFNKIAGGAVYSTDQFDDEGNRLFRSAHPISHDQFDYTFVTYPNLNMGYMLDSILTFEEEVKKQNTEDSASKYEYMSPEEWLLQYFSHIGPKRQLQEMQEMERILLWKDSKYSLEEKQKLLDFMISILKETKLEGFKFSDIVLNDLLLKNGKQDFVSVNKEYFDGDKKFSNNEKVDVEFFNDENFRKITAHSELEEFLPKYLDQSRILDVKIFQDMLLNDNWKELFQKIRTLEDNGLDVYKIFTDEVLIKGFDTGLTMDLLQFTLQWDDGNMYVVEDQKYVRNAVTPRVIDMMLTKNALNKEIYPILKKYSSQISPKWRKSIEDFEKKNPEIEDFQKVSLDWKNN